MRELPTGISNFEKLMEGNRIYVDKTMYIEKLEKIVDPAVMFLRPRKFGKTLFTSMLENYYDISKSNIFEKLFSNTYIGKNPTDKRNSYYVLRFNFSGINTSTLLDTLEGFKNSTIESIKRFINKYELDFYINTNQKAEEILNSLYTAFESQKKMDKYIL